jgi:hypothetical protein
MTSEEKNKIAEKDITNEIDIELDDIVNNQ